MTVVVDASAVGAMLFNEPEGATVAAHLRDERVVAPHLIDCELASVCVKRMRRHGTQAAESLLQLARLANLPITRMPVPAASVAMLADQTGLSAYDAAYLWLAISLDAELVTLDHRLARVEQRLREPE